MKKRLLITVFGLFYSMTFSSIYAYESLQGPTEMLYWDKEKAYNGYTLFGANSNNNSYLIDMEGNVINTWSPGKNPRFNENGNFMDARGNDFVELGWDGTTVWEYTESRKDYNPHHDFVRIFNKKLNAYTTMYIANKNITHAEAIAAGCDPKGKYDGSSIDTIVEIDMEGNIVWEYWFFDHLVQDIDPGKANFVGKGKTIADYPGRLNINLPGEPMKRDWLHINSLDYNRELDQVVANAARGEFYVIDHGNTFIPGYPKGSIALAAGPKGDFLYRFGNPSRYEQGEPASIRSNGNKQIDGSHDIQWIRPGLPGAGNFLIFNNGQGLLERIPSSYIFEINPFLDAKKKDTGNYVNPPDAGYYKREPVNQRDTHKSTLTISNHVVWIYSPKSSQGFFSHIGSGCQRLPNGNTLICAMTEGHFFEVTGEGDLVWEYINPITSKGVVKVMGDSYPMSNPAFRAYRYNADHPALKGKDLTPKGTITELAAQGKIEQPRERRGGKGGKK